MTGVAEDNIRTFADNWSGSGAIDLAGDAEELVLNAGEYMVSEVVALSCTVEILQNHYGSGDDVALYYRHGATEGACLDAAWTPYSAPFASAGYVQVRVEATL